MILPKISVITVCYNSVKTIEQTILSVINQSYPNIEYIIIDGGSTDGTVNIIKKYESKIAFWESSPDKGIYDAMNKGIKIATGDYIATLNSDDWYYDSNVIQDIVNVINSNSNIDIIHGSINICDIDGNIRYTILGDKEPWKNIQKYMPVWQPTMFVKRELYEKYGFYDLNYKIAADYEFIFRVINKCNFYCLDKIITNMRDGGVSNTRLLYINKENYKIRKQYNVNLLFNILLYCKFILFTSIRILLEKMGMIRTVNIIKSVINRNKIVLK